MDVPATFADAEAAAPPLILASASPRRRELLERVGLRVEVWPADVDESVHPAELPLSYALRVAASKAEVIARLHPERTVLAADTVVSVGESIYGKPLDAAQAREMLQQLQGRSHEVTTAVALRGPAGLSRTLVVAAEVEMRTLLASEIDEYLGCGEWRGKAGGYAVQGIAAGFVRAVRGSVTAVIGLPLAEVLELLYETGAARPAYSSRGTAA